MVRVPWSLIVIGGDAASERRGAVVSGSEAPAVRARLQLMPTGTLTRRRRGFEPVPWHVAVGVEEEGAFLEWFMILKGWYPDGGR